MSAGTTRANTRSTSRGNASISVVAYSEGKTSLMVSKSRIVTWVILLAFLTADICRYCLESVLYRIIPMDHATGEDCSAVTIATRSHNQQEAASPKLTTGPGPFL